MDVGCEEGIKDGTTIICQSSQRDRLAINKMERTMKEVGLGWGRQELVFKHVKCEVPMRFPNGIMNEQWAMQAWNLEEV